MSASKLSIKLTDKQQKQIHETTGKAVSELSLEHDAAGELSDQALDGVAGGLTFQFKLVAVKTISWAHDDSGDSSSSGSGS